MRLTVVRRLLTCLPLITLTTAASAQYTNPYTGRNFNNPVSSYLDTVIQNRMQQSMVNQQMFSQQVFNQMMMDTTRRNIGKDRIAKGRNSTRFTPSAKGSAIEALVPKELSGAERRKALEVNQTCLKQFKTAVGNMGLLPNDMADGRALAFVMAYTAYRGQDPGVQRLKLLCTNYRTTLMSDPYFQGFMDDERQQEYERLAVAAVLSISARDAASRATPGSEKRAVLLQTAERLSAPILQRLWGKPIDGLELTSAGFGDRGTRVVQSGGSRTTFQREPAHSIVRSYAARFGSRDLGWNEAYYDGLLRRFDAFVEKSGLHTNDLADANAAAGAIAYGVYSDGKVALNSRQIGWLRAEMRKDILGSADFQRKGDAAMQEAYESLALRAMHLTAQYEKATSEIRAGGRRGGDALEGLSNAYLAQSAGRLKESHIRSARTLLEEIFQPRRFDDYTLTSDGFRKK